MSGSGLKSVLESFSAGSPIFPNDSGFLVTVTENTKIGKVLERMVNHKMSALPVVDAKSGDPLYFVTLLDVVSYAMKVLSEDDVKHSLWARLTSWIKDDSSDMENTSVADVVDKLYSSGPRPVNVRVTGDIKLEAAIDRMLRKHANRALVTEPENKTKALSVLSLSRVLELVAPHVEEFPNHKFTLRQLGLGSPYCISVKQSDTAYTAFKLMSTHYVGSVAVVNDNGELVGNISASDFKLMHFEHSYWSLLGKSVQEYMEEVSKHVNVTHARDAATTWRNGKPMLLCLTPDATVAETLLALKSFHVHHIYLVNEQMKPVGVISIRDVLREALASLDQ